MWARLLRTTIRGSGHDKSFFDIRSADGPHKMKRKTASERQRNLERHYGSHTFRLRFGNRVCNSIYWMYRRIHFFLCFYDNDVEVDIEDLLTNPFNTQPPSLDSIERLTQFKRPFVLFLYRNFKSISANGRMSLTQWRQIFRMLFKGAADYDFADRVFYTIAGNRAHKLLTFEDLLIFLYDISQSFNHCIDPQAPCPSTTAAQFSFSLMQPNAQASWGKTQKVDEQSFIQYALCVFNLNSSIVGCASNDAATFGMLPTGSTSQGSDKTARRETIHPALLNLARAQFRQLDSDEDGFITLQDIQQLFEQRESLYEPLILKREAELTKAAAD